MISFDYNIKVYYKDIDKMGVVYYTRYLEYFEAARTEMLKSIGLIVTDIENKGFFLPVVSAHCDYKQGANFEDEITIRYMALLTMMAKPSGPLNYFSRLCRIISNYFLL